MEPGDTGAVVCAAYYNGKEKIALQSVQEEVILEITESNQIFAAGDQCDRDQFKGSLLQDLVPV